MAVQLAATVVMLSLTACVAWSFVLKLDCLPAAHATAGVQETIADDGHAMNGPFFTVIGQQLDSSRGLIARVRPLDFAAFKGKWVVFVFATTELNNSHVWNLSRGLSAIHAVTGSMPDTQLWLVRMDHRSNLMSDIRGGSMDGGFVLACYVGHSPCIDGFAYAGVVPGKLGLYFLPQNDWLRSQFKHIPQDPGRFSPSWVVPVQLPYIAVLDPSGHLHGWSDGWHGCPVTRRYTAGCVAKSVLFALDSLRVQFGDNPMLTIPSKAVSPTFSDYVSQVAE